MDTTLPPGPRSRVLSTAALVRDYVGAHRRWRARYGEVYTVRDLTGTVVMTAKLEHVRRLFAIADPEALGEVAPQSMDVLLGRHSLLLLGGREHQRERKVLKLPFCPRALGAWEPIIAEATRRVFAALPEDEPFAVLDHTRRLTLEVIARTVFGAEGEVVDRLVDAVAETMARFEPAHLLRAGQRRMLGLSSFARYQDASDHLDELLLAHIAELRDRVARGEGRGREDVLSLLLAACEDQGLPLSDRDICDELRTMMVGGHETTAITMAWALYYLHRDRALLARVRDELIGLGAAPGSTTGLGKGARWLQGIIDETLRLRPPAGQHYRKLLRPLELDDWRLPAGTIVSPAVTLVHHDPAHYPEPERFDPTRFFDQRPNPAAFMPFGGGSHRCLGAEFANVELRVALTTLLLEFELELLDRHEPDWQRIGLALGPQNGVLMCRRETSRRELELAGAAE